MLSFAYGSEPTGSISGEVVSQRTQDPIIGAITDASGTFAIANINHFPRQGTSGGGLGMVNVDLIEDAWFSTGGS